MRKFTTKLACGILAASMVVSLAACSSNKNTDKKSEKETKTAVTEEEQGDRLQAEWMKDAIIYEVNVRQYTQEGTFNAFSEHLERLKEMGVNTLWFMPIYSISQLNKKGTLGSYYSISDYKSVNSEFGTTDDFKKLVDKAHEMGFHVMLDWVANHTGWDHTWVTEHPEYYLTDDTGNIICPPGTDWTDVAQLDYKNEDMRAAMIDAMSYWIKDMDIDGFRCDYAQGVPVDFWEEARTALDQIKPVYMLAEDGTNANSLLVNAFDSDYNFNLYDKLSMSRNIPSQAANVFTAAAQENLPYASFRMNFLDNHDKNTYDGTMEERYGTDTLGAFYTVVFTSYGIPLVYSGNEEDIDMSLQFFEKDPINFGDYKYQDLLTKLCHIKTENEPLFNGVYGGKMVKLENDNKSVLSFTREKNGKKITVIVNLSKDEQSVTYTDKISSGTILIHGDANGMDDKEGAVNTDDLNKLSAWEYYVIAQ